MTVNYPMRQVYKGIHLIMCKSREVYQCVLVHMSADNPRQTLHGYSMAYIFHLDASVVLFNVWRYLVKKKLKHEDMGWGQRLKQDEVQLHVITRSTKQVQWTCTSNLDNITNWTELVLCICPLGLRNDLFGRRNQTLTWFNRQRE